MLWILAFWTPKKESKRDKTWNPMWNYWDCHEHSRTFLILWVLIMAHCTWCPCRIHWPSTPATKDAMCATVPTVSLPEPQTLWTLLQHVGSTGEAAQVSSVRMGWVRGEITSAVCTCTHTHTALDAMLHLQWVGVKFHENLLTLLTHLMLYCCCFGLEWSRAVLRRKPHCQFDKKQQAVRAVVETCRWPLSVIHSVSFMPKVCILWWMHLCNTCTVWETN